MYYYYFTKNQIKVVPFEIDCVINRAYTALTEEQTAFIEDNPTASVSEVRNCRLYVAPTPTAPTLDGVKAQAKTDLSAYSAQTMGRFVSDLQLANAQSSLYLLGVDSASETVYTAEKATSTIAKYNTVGKQCRDKYYEAVQAIDGFDTVDDVAGVVMSAKAFYDNITYNE